MLDYSAFPSVSNPVFEHLWRDFSAYGALPTGAPVVHQRQQSPVEYTRGVVRPDMMGYAFAPGSVQYTAMLGAADVAAAQKARNTQTVLLAAAAAVAAWWFWRSR